MRTSRPLSPGGLKPPRQTTLVSQCLLPLVVTRTMQPSRWTSKSTQPPVLSLPIVPCTAIGHRHLPQNEHKNRGYLYPQQGRDTPYRKKDTKRRLSPPSCASFVWSSVLCYGYFFSLTATLRLLGFDNRFRFGYCLGFLGFRF